MLASIYFRSPYIFPLDPFLPPCYAATNNLVIPLPKLYNIYITPLAIVNVYR